MVFQAALEKTSEKKPYNPLGGIFVVVLQGLSVLGLGARVCVCTKLLIDS